MSAYGIFRRDEFGYPKWAYPRLMEIQDAIDLQREKYPDFEVLTYWQYLREQDPDELSESALRKKMESPPKFSEKTAAVTGTFGGIKRKNIESILESRGYRIVSKVCASTSILIAGEGGGRKSADAITNGVNVISWDSFCALLT